MDSINSHHVLREANLTGFVKAANNPVLLPAPNHPIPNPCLPNPGLTGDHQQLWRVVVVVGVPRALSCQEARTTEVCHRAYWF